MHCDHGLEINFRDVAVISDLDGVLGGEISKVYKGELRRLGNNFTHAEW